jgi:hypothetical protein
VGRRLLGWSTDVSISSGAAQRRSTEPFEFSKRVIHVPCERRVFCLPHAAQRSYRLDCVAAERRASRICSFVQRCVYRVSSRAATPLLGIQSELRRCLPSLNGNLVPLRVVGLVIFTTVCFNAKSALHSFLRDVAYAICCHCGISPKRCENSCEKGAAYTET